MVQPGDRLGDWVVTHIVEAGDAGASSWVRNGLVTELRAFAVVAPASATLDLANFARGRVSEGSGARLIGAGSGEGRVWLVFDGPVALPQPGDPSASVMAAVNAEIERPHDVGVHVGERSVGGVPDALSVDEAEAARIDGTSPVSPADPWGATSAETSPQAPLEARAPGAEGSPPIVSEGAVESPETTAEDAGSAEVRVQGGQGSPDAGPNGPAVFDEELAHAETDGTSPVLAEAEHARRRESPETPGEDAGSPEVQVEGGEALTAQDGPARAENHEYSSILAEAGRAGGRESSETPGEDAGSAPPDAGPNGPAAVDPEPASAQTDGVSPVLAQTEYVGGRESPETPREDAGSASPDAGSNGPAAVDPEPAHAETRENSSVLAEAERAGGRESPETPGEETGSASPDAGSNGPAAVDPEPARAENGEYSSILAESARAGGRSSPETPGEDAGSAEVRVEGGEALNAQERAPAVDLAPTQAQAEGISLVLAGLELSAEREYASTPDGEASGPNEAEMARADGLPQIFAETARSEGRGLSDGAAGDPIEGTSNVLAEQTPPGRPVGASTVDPATPEAEASLPTNAPGVPETAAEHLASSIPPGAVDRSPDVSTHAETEGRSAILAEADPADLGEAARTPDAERAPHAVVDVATEAEETVDVGSGGARLGDVSAGDPPSSRTSDGEASADLRAENLPSAPVSDEHPDPDRPTAGEGRPTADAANDEDLDDEEPLFEMFLEEGEQLSRPALPRWVWVAGLGSAVVVGLALTAAAVVPALRPAPVATTEVASRSSRPGGEAAPRPADSADPPATTSAEARDTLRPPGLSAATGPDPALPAGEAAEDTLRGGRSPGPTELADRELELEIGAPSAAGTSAGGAITPVAAPRVTSSAAPAVDAMIQGVFRRNQRSLQVCYERSVRGRPDLKGRWRVSLVLAKDGTPAKVSARHLDMEDGPMTTCVEREVASWKFGSVPETVTWSEVFTFKPQ